MPYSLIKNKKIFLPNLNKLISKKILVFYINGITDSNNCIFLNLYITQIFIFYVLQYLCIVVL